MLEAGTGRIKIIDFGLSKRQQSAVTLGVGTIDVSGYPRVQLWVCLWLGCAVLC